MCGFLRRVQLKAFFHDKEDDSNTSDKDTFETLQARKSKWTPLEGQFASLDFFINKCRHDINKLNFNRNTKFSNLSSAALWSFGGPTFIKKKLCGNFLTPLFMLKSIKISPPLTNKFQEHY